MTLFDLTLCFVYFQMISQVQLIGDENFVIEVRFDLLDDFETPTAESDGNCTVQVDGCIYKENSPDLSMTWVLGVGIPSKDTIPAVSTSRLLTLDDTICVHFDIGTIYFSSSNTHHAFHTVKKCWPMAANLPDYNEQHILISNENQTVIVEGWIKTKCINNYYGCACEQLCEPGGHYDCDNEGRKSCHDAWYPKHKRNRCNGGAETCTVFCEPGNGKRCDQCGRTVCKKGYLNGTDGNCERSKCPADKRFSKCESVCDCETIEVGEIVDSYTQLFYACKCDTTTPNTATDYYVADLSSSAALLTTSQSTATSSSTYESPTTIASTSQTSTSSALSRKTTTIKSTEAISKSPGGKSDDSASESTKFFSKSKSSGLSTAAIVVVVIVLLAVSGLAGLIYYTMRKRRSQTVTPDMSYYVSRRDGESMSIENPVYDPNLL